MKALVLVLLAASVSVGTASWQQQTADRDLVIKLTAEYEDAIRRRDASVHERLFAQDYTYTAGNGNFIDRNGHIAFTKSGATSVESLISEDQLVRVYGDMAIVTGRWLFTGSRPAGAVSAQRIRYLLVYLKRDGRWQIVAEQRTGGGREPAMR